MTAISAGVLFATVLATPAAAALVQRDSDNWAGYVVTPTASTAQQFNDVRAMWTQPTATCPSSVAEVVTWLGLSGLDTGSGSVQQVGTLVRCDNFVPTYFVWYEMFPENPVIVQQIRPGDSIAALVKFDPATSQFTLSLNTNSSFGSGFLVKRACPARVTCARDSAEWIVEDPATSTFIFPITNFGRFNFTNVSVTDSNGVMNTLRTSAPWLKTRLTMRDTIATYVTTGVTSTDGRNFTMTWVHQ